MSLLQLRYVQKWLKKLNKRYYPETKMPAWVGKLNSTRFALLLELISLFQKHLTTFTIKKKRRNSRGPRAPVQPPASAAQPIPASKSPLYVLSSLFHLLTF
jgi:hypothetical protein